MSRETPGSSDLKGYIETALEKNKRLIASNRVRIVLALRVLRVEFSCAWSRPAAKQLAPRQTGTIKHFPPRLFH